MKRARLEWQLLANLLVALCVVLGTGTPAFAAPPAGRLGVEVFVLTFGPGDHAFSKFGHNAVLVVDRERRADHVYNFGTFSFSSPTLFSDFLQGRLMYWVSVGKQGSTLAAYAGDNRSVVAQKLNLTRRETEQLLERLAHSALPENRFYRYHYYLDNCSTRVRDVLDEVLLGQLQKSKQVPAVLTWREHTSRLTSDSRWINLGLNVVLGSDVDRATSRWEEMFLPAVLQEELSTTRKADGTSLVEREQVWHASSRPPLSSRPPRQAPMMLLTGFVLGGAQFGLVRLGRRSRAARATWLVLLGLLGLGAGLLGCIFALFWFYTDHGFAHANENLLLFPPWALALPVTAIGALLGRQRWLGRLYGVLLTLSLGSVLGLALKLLPGFEQDNWMFLALAIPLWATLAYAARSELGCVRRAERASVFGAERA